MIIWLFLLGWVVREDFISFDYKCIIFSFFSKIKEGLEKNGVWVNSYYCIWEEIIVFFYFFVLNICFMVSMMEVVDSRIVEGLVKVVWLLFFEKVEWV